MTPPSRCFYVRSHMTTRWRLYWAAKMSTRPQPCCTCASGRVVWISGFGTWSFAGALLRLVVQTSSRSRRNIEWPLQESPSAAGAAAAQAMDSAFRAAGFGYSAARRNPESKGSGVPKANPNMHAPGSETPPIKNLIPNLEFTSRFYIPCMPHVSNSWTQPSQGPPRR